VRWQPESPPGETEEILKQKKIKKILNKNKKEIKKLNSNSAVTYFLYSRHDSRHHTEVLN